MTLFDEAVNLEMLRLAELPNVKFYGQSIRYDGAAIYNSLEGVPIEKRFEMPVAEDFQLGFCIGVSLAGVLPVCIYPRMDFMVLALNQLVNHLDKLPLYGWKPKVILRTTVGKKFPLNAGPQHTQNHSEAFQKMLRSIEVFEVRTPEDVSVAYNLARELKTSALIVENESSPG